MEDKTEGDTCLYRLLLLFLFACSISFPFDMSVVDEDHEVVQTLIFIRNHLWDVKLSDDQPNGFPETVISNLKRLSTLGWDVFRLVSRYESWIIDVCRNVEGQDTQVEDGDTTETMVVECIGLLARFAVDETVIDHLPLNFTPLVYSDIFVVHQLIPLVIPLIEKGNDCHATENGLFLLKHALSLVKSSSISCPHLPRNFYDYLRLFPVHCSLVKVMKFSPEASRRRHSTLLLKQLIHSFGREEMRLMIDILINTPDQEPGIVELALNEYRCLVTDNECSFLCKKHLFKTVRNVIRFCGIKPEGPEDDNCILDKSESLLSLLNFLRFLFIRDPIERNETGIWEMKEQLIDNLLTPLLKGIEDKQSSLLLELKKVKEEGSEVKNQKLEFIKKMTIQVQNNPEGEEKETDEECPEDYEEQGMEAMIVRLQMIQSVTQRVSNIISPSSSSESQ